jgi:hypothetical protein
MNHKLLRAFALVLSIMKNLKFDRALAALVLAMTITPSPACAKWVDNWAHLDREDYWSSHAIYLARITEIKRPTITGAFWVTSFEPIKFFSGSDMATNRSIRSFPDEDDSNTGDYPDGFPSGAGSTGEILVSEDLRFHNVTVVRVIASEYDQPLVAVVGRI